MGCGLPTRWCSAGQVPGLWSELESQARGFFRLSSIETQLWLCCAARSRAVRRTVLERTISTPFLISVVIVNWNSRDDLRACLAALAKQTDSAFETIVVDNGSEDDSVQMVATEFPTVQLLPTGENLGFAEGCNRGLALAQGEWIALLNNDTLADSNWLAQLREQAVALPADVGMLQSKLLFKAKPTHLNSAGLLLFENATARDRCFDEADPGQSAIEEIFAPTAGAALYRRSMLEAVRQSTGYLDRDFFMYFEDVDLGWRCRLAGWRAFYVPTSFVLHAFQNSTKRKPGDFVGWHTRKNRLRSLAKNASLKFFVTSLAKSFADVLWILRWRGRRDLREALHLARQGLRLRHESQASQHVPRRSVEKSWVTRR